MLRHSLTLVACVLASASATPISAQERVEPDAFRSDGSYVVRDNAGKPLERVSPDPYRDKGYVVQDYDTGKVQRRVEPDLVPGESRRGKSRPGEVVASRK